MSLLAADVRPCAACGAPVGRKPSEGRAHFSQKPRVSCPGLCAAWMARGTDVALVGPLDAHMPGARTLLARTCLKCGVLLDASAFASLVGGRWRERSCMACVTRGCRENETPEAKVRRMDTTRLRQERYAEQSSSAAGRNKAEWSSLDLETANRDDLPVMELARMLGRTYGAVVATRARCRTHPRWQRRLEDARRANRGAK